MPSALPLPWLLVSNRRICSKSLNAAVVVGPCCRRAGRVGCLADVYGLGRGNVVGFFPSCYFIACFISGIAMLLRSLLFCLLCLAFPTKGLPDKQMASTVAYALFPSETRHILGVLGKICGFQAFASLKSDTHWSCWLCISLQ